MEIDKIRKYSNFIYEYIEERNFESYIFEINDNGYFIVVRFRKPKSLSFDLLFGKDEFEVSTKGFPEVIFCELQNLKYIEEVLDMLFESYILHEEKTGGIGRTSITFINKQGEEIYRVGPKYFGLPLPMLKTEHKTALYFPYK